VLFFPVAHKPPGYDVFAFFAADHRMAINVGYFARVSNARINAANAALTRDLMAGALRRDSLYVFWNGAPIEDSLRSEDGVGVVDGYAVVAPGWFEFSDCCGDARSTLHRRLSAQSARALVVSEPMEGPKRAVSSAPAAHVRSEYHVAAPVLVKSKER